MDKKIDLYLWIAPDRHILYKVSNLDWDYANELAMLWFGMNEVNDYMFVIKGSTPWTEPKPTIIDISPEWIIEKTNASMLDAIIEKE